MAEAFTDRKDLVLGQLNSALNLRPEHGLQTDGNRVFTTDPFVTDEQLKEAIQTHIPDLDWYTPSQTKRIRNAPDILRQWAQDAKTVANQGTNVTQAQQKALFNRFGILCEHLADLIELR